MLPIHPQCTTHQEVPRGREGMKWTIQVRPRNTHRALQSGVNQALGGGSSRLVSPTCIQHLNYRQVNFGMVSIVPLAERPTQMRSPASRKMRHGHHPALGGTSA